jgi:LAS superfamily LD-carboxypeptidase LdcB
MIIEDKIVTGLSTTHVVEFGTTKLHKGVVEPVNLLIVEAAKQGFELAIASGFRSFERQLLIWNEKAAGLRPIYADDGSLMCAADFSEEDLMFAILRWSALPGGSRHHWGTDMDIYDRAQLRNGDQLQLTIAETIDSGPFAALHRWLDGYLSDVDSVFFRPYVQLTGGIAPEPWHLSFAPLAYQFQLALTPDVLWNLIAQSNIALANSIQRHFDEIFARFIRLPDDVYPPKFRNKI